MNHAQETKVHMALLLAIILIGWGLATLRLGDRSFWADEGATAHKAQQTTSLAEAARLHKDFHFLHFALTMGLVRLSRSELVLRFPSAMAATLALPVLYVLGSRLLRRTAGLVGAFLLAISPFAVGYAQEARSYALLQLYAGLSLLLLVLALEKRRWFWWAGFVIATTLLLYTHFFGWFVVGAEVLWVLIVLLWRTVKGRKLDARLPWLAVSLLIIAVLYLPLGPALVEFWQQFGPGQESPQVAGLQSFQLSLRFFGDMLAVFGARSYGWRLWLFAISILLGFASLFVRRRWSVLLLIILWFAVPLAGLTVIASQHFFDYRYLIFTLPIFLLMTAEGLAWLVSLFGRGARVPRAWLVEPLLALGLAGLLFVPANLPALRDHYRWEKENWRHIADFVRQNLEPDEAIYVTPLFWANPLLFYQPSFEARLAGGAPNNLYQLQRATKDYPGLWFLRYVGPLADPSGRLTSWINDQQFELLIDGETCGYGIHVYYRRFDDLAATKQAELLRQAAIFCPTDPRFQSSPP